MAQLLNKQKLELIQVQHQPCVMCGYDNSTEEEVSKMLGTLNLSTMMDRELAGAYHSVLHMNVQAAKTLLFFQPSPNFLWLHEIAETLNMQDEHHGGLIKMLVEDVLSER